MRIQYIRFAKPHSRFSDSGLKSSECRIVDAVLLESRSKVGPAGTWLLQKIRAINRVPGLGFGALVASFIAIDLPLAIRAHVQGEGSKAWGLEVGVIIAGWGSCFETWLPSSKLTWNLKMSFELWVEHCPLEGSPNPKQLHLKELALTFWKYRGQPRRPLSPQP